MPTLLQAMAERERLECEGERQRLLGELRTALRELVPEGTAWVFGSLARPGRFNAYSDIDIALDAPPDRHSEYWLQGELEHRLGRRVDITLLGETRLRTAIEREGLRWTLSA